MNNILQQLLPEMRLFVLIVAFFIGIVFMYFGGTRSKALLLSIGFGMAMSFMFGAFTNWLPQVRADPPTQEIIDPTKLSPEQMMDLGRKIVFGEGGDTGTKSIGKGQCPLCHIFGEHDDPTTGRCPNLFGEAERANLRIKDPRYLANVQGGKAKAKSHVEYIIESTVNPSAFVVAGFGIAGTNDTESPMPVIIKPPISLSPDELTAVISWLQGKEGGPVTVDREQVLAWFPEDLKAAASAPGAAVTASLPTQPGVKIGNFLSAISEELDPKDIIKAAGCPICHGIPGVTAPPGTPVPERTLGPRLIEKVNAALRISSPEYQADVTAGKAHATTPRDYVRESILLPDAHTVKCFREGEMPCSEAAKRTPPDMAFPPGIMAAEKFSTKLTAGALEKLVDFLLTIDDQGPGTVAENADIPVATGPLPVKDEGGRPLQQETPAVLRTAAK